MESSPRDHPPSESREQLRALDEILRTVAGSSFDLRPVLQAVVSGVARLCEADVACLLLDEGGRLALAARTDCSPAFAHYLEEGEPDNGATPSRRAALEGRTVQIADLLTEPGATVTRAHRAECIRSVLAVPMRRDERLLGVISVWRREVRPFAERHVELAEAFAGQAVIAVENRRLQRELEMRNRELAEALQQQDATAEILRTISGSPGDAMPVFRTIVRHALALCGSMFANVFRFDGERLHYVASENTAPGYVELLHSKYPMRPDRSQVSGRVLLSNAVVRLEDACVDPDYDQRFPTAMGWRRMLGVPMLRDGKALGAIVVGWADPAPIPAATENLLKTFADQAVIAIENARLFDELQDKTRQLEVASAYKSRFLAAASHDLRQPLHALNLFVGQLRSERSPTERGRLVERIHAALGAINQLFDALLDMSRLEAGMLEANLAEFPAERLLRQMETTFAAAAREKGLTLRVAATRAWIRSDFILLERILLNLASNAVRYTDRGGIVIGCRRRGNRLRLEIWDTGPGIPENQRENIFREFYRLPGADAGRRGGLGLGLAIVERLGQLLDHPVEVASVPGRGSRFSVSVPRAAKRRGPAEPVTSAAAPRDPVAGKLIVVIDDDALVLDSMRGVLGSWGCDVVAAASGAEALKLIGKIRRQPDAIVSDYRLGADGTGIEAIERLRDAIGRSVPAFLVSGDTSPERLRDARVGGYHLLHKPVPPPALRALLNRLLRSRHEPARRASPVASRPNRRAASARSRARRRQ